MKMMMMMRRKWVGYPLILLGLTPPADTFTRSTDARDDAHNDEGEGYEGGGNGDERDDEVQHLE